MIVSVVHFLLPSVDSAPKLADGIAVNLHSVVATRMQAESPWESDTWCRQWEDCQRCIWYRPRAWKMRTSTRLRTEIEEKSILSLTSNHTGASNVKVSFILIQLLCA